MDQQVQEELLEANMQTEGSRGKERAPSEVSSKRSLSSSKSSVASAAAKARASAEAARAKMAFAKRQLEMKKEKARLEQERATVEANLEALELERDAAAALAEAEVLEAAAMERDDNRSEISTLSSHVISKRTEEYVKQQTQMSSDFSTLPLNISSATCAQESAPRLIDKSQSMNAAYDGDTNTVQERNRLYDSERLQSTRLSPYNLPHSLPNAAFKASPHQDPASKRCTAQPDTRYYSQSQATPMLDFAKFIARRELVTTGLTKFDDNPENFRAWESSFVNATKDLQLSASEELDLLVKWLGKESSDHVRRIRAVYVTNPQAALQMSRTRLHECYATPEVIERALFTRLDNFLRLSPKDNVKLRELADLLMEILAAKGDAYLPGLAYLDTPRGITPIVEKLPSSLQEKWLYAGSRFKTRTCAGSMETAGRKAVGFQIETLDGKTCLDLPPLIECNEIMSNRSEIPTPEVALAHPHLKTVAQFIPKLDPDAQILVLLGRDMIRVHKVRQQINGPHDAPFAQRLDLGWVIVGDVCIERANKPMVSVFKTHILDNGRPSLLTPCQSHIKVKEKLCHGGEHKSGVFPHAFNHATEGVQAEDKLGLKVFDRTKNDNKPAMSFEDETFLEIMQAEFHQDEQKNWVAPLPFRSPRPLLPNNREQALSRLNSLRRTLSRNLEMKKQFSAFMEKLFQNHHAERAPPIYEDEECWYLPIFGVYHPQKPGEIRVVFDSSAQYQGISLNNVLLSGPDLNNSLLGVLLRFRKDRIAIMADIQQMFYGFLVKEDHRNYLRFLWYCDGNLSKEVVDYRMRVHVFGNSPSPSVAIYGLWLAAKRGEQEYGTDTSHFVNRHFYVDDGLVSFPTEAEAIDLLKRTEESLSKSNIKLHKIASNSVKVMQTFLPEDLASGLQDLNFGNESWPAQRSLGLYWDIKSDTFTFKVAANNEPYTHRGVLSVVNSLFDPLGFVAPVTIRGRAVVRELTKEVHDWDAVFPEEKENMWEEWKTSLQKLSNLHITRTYLDYSLSNAPYTELCVFSDALSWAIGAVAYLRALTDEGEVKVGFVLGKAKLSPRPEPSVPRLELCGAVLAVEMAEHILDELDHKPNAVKFFCDSKVVLGYIYNQSRRFFVYVHNRVQRIRQSTSPNQWSYVPTVQNPADLATRSVITSQLNDTIWFTGPSFLYQQPQEQQCEFFEMVNPETDAEVRPCVTSFATRVERSLFSERFQRFSTWESLLRAVSFLIHQACSHTSSSISTSHTCKGWHQCSKIDTPEEQTAAKRLILLHAQKELYPEEYTALQRNGKVSHSSALWNLDPYIDDGLLRVGGRLKHASIESEVKNPIIIPKQSHVAKLLVSYHHSKVHHQGRQFTEGAIRQAGLWIVGGKRLINSILHRCVACRRLRGKQEVQKMADLPPERLSTSPPFTYVGLDVFGPWTVVTRRTRGGVAENKRRAILFTCMSTRAVHIEVIESMNTASCINALRRFFAVRGPAKQLRSDRGTNFIGASQELGMQPAKENQTSLLKYLHENGCTWEFNPPHASHMGGAWERMIGVTRRILDGMLLQKKHAHLTHEVLCTLMAEVSAIINARPLVPVSADPYSPFILTPAMLLTQKPIVPVQFENYTEKDLLKCQWKRVQALANEFWSRWRKEYISTLQPRRKWHETHRNLHPGDVVLLKQVQSPRNDWPLGLITSVFPGNDGRVRKVEVRTTSGSNVKTFLRPISDVILLLAKEE
ncbi:hypothetical protein ROHU_004747 [Labeo rohita]|uniref:Integrase catalytic domain-containing protein n=1 Tax=Labeo rohita TaxID=84645 RepID=A0A498NI54_LABRO|nr:hypothetical protein ROHU_004747 [Labeo rohita]